MEKYRAGRNQGAGKDFCVTRDGPKSGCESYHWIFFLNQWLWELLHDFFFKPEAHAWYFFGICITPPPPHQKSNGPPLTENAWSCVIEIWIRGFGVLKERLSEGLRFVVWPRLNYKTKTSSVSRLLASDKAFERGSSFCSLTRPKLQNEDPVGFASFGVRQSVWARVFVL